MVKASCHSYFAPSLHRRSGALYRTNLLLSSSLTVVETLIRFVWDYQDWPGCFLSPLPTLWRVISGVLAVPLRRKWGIIDGRRKPGAYFPFLPLFRSFFLFLIHPLFVWVLGFRQKQCGSVGDVLDMPAKGWGWQRGVGVDSRRVGLQFLFFCYTKCKDMIPNGDGIGGRRRRSEGGREGTNYECVCVLSFDVRQSISPSFTMIVIFFLPHFCGQIHFYQKNREHSLFCIKQDISNDLRCSPSSERTLWFPWSSLTNPAPYTCQRLHAGTSYICTRTRTQITIYAGHISHSKWIIWNILNIHNPWYYAINLCPESYATTHHFSGAHQQQISMGAGGTHMIYVLKQILCFFPLQLIKG